MSQLQTTIEWPFQVNGETDSCERHIIVEYEYHRARRGKRDSLCGVAGAGAQLEPDEPPTVEIIKVQLESPTVYSHNVYEDITDDLSDEQKERLEELCFFHVADIYEEMEEQRHERD